MKLIELQVKGAIAYPSLQIVKFNDKRKVAIVGDNGSGKTTLLDMIPVALYGQAPNRPKSLYDCFVGRDALVDLTFEHGGRHIQIRRMIDAENRAQKRYLFVDGIPVTEGKSAEFDHELSKVLGMSKELFLATVYHAQNGNGNPLAMDDGSRRGLLVEILKIDQYERPLQLVKNELEAVNKQADAYRAQAQLLSAGLIDGDELETQQAWHGGVALAEGDKLKALEAQLEAKRQEIADAKANAQNVTDLQARLATASTELSATQRQIKDLETRIVNNRDVLLAQSDSINNADAVLNASEAMKVVLESRAKGLQASIDEARLAQQAIINERNKELAEHRAKQAHAGNTENQHLLVLRAAENALNRAKASISDLKPQVITLDVVPCEGQPMHSECPLLASARVSKGRLDEAEAALPELEAAFKKEQNNQEAHKLVSGVCKLDVEAAQAKLNEAMAAPVADAVQAELKQVQAELETIAQAVQANATLAALKPRLDNASEAISAYQQQLETLQTSEAATSARLADLQGQLDAVSTLAASLEAKSNKLNQLMSQQAASQKSREDALAELARVNGQIEEQAKRLALLDETRAKQGIVLEEVPTLELLKEGLGDKGAKALLIDAAAPAISQLVNDLIRECYGARFTVAVKTLKELLNGESREALQFIVVDNETGNETFVECLSGGEQAIVKEAINLALSIYSSQLNNLNCRTLFRDEASAPLSEANTVRYMGMLDKACVIGGFEQVFFVSHKGVAQDLADSRIEISSQAVTVCN
jgi:DNA repair protein SbcC/Rad50